MNLTGSSYDFAVELLAAAGSVPGHGATRAMVRDALDSVGFRLEERRMSCADAMRASAHGSGRMFYVSARRRGGRAGHAWAIVDGKSYNGWQGGFNFVIFEVFST
jgi:hypothetical protein